MSMMQKVPLISHCKAISEGLFLVRLKGFEPPTLWFVAKYSIQLSYRRILL